ncbi:MAG: hypothetical protein NTY01_09305 [Verrucomicrobia bacterium]|nr:hypothetical protein [Verrucomicrobiota bacterium]
MVAAQIGIPEDASVGGVGYHDVKWGPVRGNNITFFHAKGSKTVPTYMLPEDVQRRLGLDRNKLAVEAAKAELLAKWPWIAEEAKKAPNAATAQAYLHDAALGAISSDGKLVRKHAAGVREIHGAVKAKNVKRQIEGNKETTGTVFEIYNYRQFSRPSELQRIGQFVGPVRADNRVAVRSGEFGFIANHATDANIGDDVLVEVIEQNPTTTGERGFLLWTPIKFMAWQAAKSSDTTSKR